MEAIVIEKEKFDEIFKELLNQLMLIKFVTPNVARNPEHVRIISDMHSSFHYYICEAKTKIMNR